MTVWIASIMKKTFLLFIFFLLQPLHALKMATRFGYVIIRSMIRLLLQQYRSKINSIQFTGNSLTVTVAKKEMLSGLEGLLAIPIADKKTNFRRINRDRHSPHINIHSIVFSEGNFILGKEGFVISTNEQIRKI